MRDKKKIIQKANELQEADFKIIQILKDVKYLIQFRPLEDYLNKWLGAMYVKGLPVSVAEFQVKALEVYKELKGTYYFEPGYDWVCYFENRWCHKFLRDGIKKASDNNNFLMRKRFKVDDDHDQSQQAYRKDPEDASINDTSNFNASGNVERQVSNDCESQQNTESTKYNPNELEVYDSTLLYKMTFNDCIHSLKVPDFAHLLSDNQKEDLENNLRYFMSTMTSVEQLLNDLLMNEIWKPFGKFMCFGDVAWVCQLKIEIEKESKERNINQKAVLCTACYEKLKDSYQKYDCVKESKFHQLDLDFNIMQRTCSVCLKSTIYYRPAAQCCFCIIMFWVAKNIVLSLHSRNEINKEHHWLK
ncbi:uncharacterized protein LOC141536437 [Cotesia typhae]|uniref:uncharacterized protein LOC141536437 n=1 Tax=Cotesia typhae TaxID=2053667 RepID=UPI003D681C4B